MKTTNSETRERKIEQTLQEIASNYLDIPTLQPQSTGYHDHQRDVHDLPICAIRLALRAAYIAGGDDKAEALFDARRNA